MALLITFFLLSILASFLCSILEAVLLSITPSYIRKAGDEGKSTGKLLVQYKDDIDRPLSAILTLNTIAHTVGAIGVGAQAGHLFGERSVSLGFMSISLEGVIAGVMTLAILILSEIIPKTLGANNWRALAPFSVNVIRIIIWILYPFVWMSQIITRALKVEKNISVFSRRDLVLMAEETLKSGAIDQNESSIIKNLLDFRTMNVRDIMTPKTVALMGDETVSIQDFYNENQPLRHSRIPIYNEDRDNVTGMILKNDLYKNIIEGKASTTLASIKKPITFIQDDLDLPTLFESISKQRRHQMIVTDDFGNVVGLVTLEDLLETMLGTEIIDESDDIADLQQLAREKWEEERAKNQELPPK